MDFENKIFNLYSDFITEKSIYSPFIYNDIPQILAEFPTITFIESDNRDSNTNNSIDKIEFVDEHQIKIEIYTKNMNSDNGLIARKIVTTELKNLTIDFLRKYGFKRTACNKAEYLDLNVDRTIIVAECSVNNWNNKIR